MTKGLSKTEVERIKQRLASGEQVIFTELCVYRYDTGCLCLLKNVHAITTSTDSFPVDKRAKTLFKFGFSY